MNKIIKTVAIALALPFSLFSQVQTKLPKMHIETNFLTSHFELGDKRISEKDLGLHLEKNSAQAFHIFTQAKTHQTIGYVTLGLGVGSIFAARAAKSNSVKLMILTGGLVSLGTSMYFTFSSPIKYNKAKVVYNKQAGY